MEKINLNGDWELREVGKDEVIPAKVPGVVHLDLQAAEKIPDPYFRDNELSLQWIGRTDWSYCREFEIADELLANEKVLLNCAGLDTLAEIKINDRSLGNTDNMFRTWEFDVKPLLQSGINFIEVIFANPIEYIRGRSAKRELRSPICVGHEEEGRSLLRKEPCNFGWDWGPVLTTSGIWKDIEIRAFNTARIGDMQILQDHTDGQVELTVKVTAVDKSGEVTADVEVSLLGESIGVETRVPFSGETAECSLKIADPQLWWPNGLGEQPLYEVKVTLRNQEEEELEVLSQRVGLRTLRVCREKDQWGESFTFKVNSVPFFAKGANWIPADTFAPAVTPEWYADLLNSAADANMNMLRVWGGGIYENDVFYDLCDQLGICIWQDFMFACASYPADDEEFMANVKEEAAGQIKRLRNHPCLALWCGNNELEMFLVNFRDGEDFDWPRMPKKYYCQLFDKLVSDQVGKLDPETDYWPSSPHTPHGDRTAHDDPTCGDAHLWAVWHGREPFEKYREFFHRFCSEFGFQSFPEPKTTYSYTEPIDRNISSRVMEHHQRSGIGNARIIEYLLSWFPLPKGFENTLWMSQILQGMSIKYAVEHWRRNMPQCMGALYWQLNDCWPVASWASIDANRRWKALHYIAKRFFAPLMVSGVENCDDKTIELHVTSDFLVESDAELKWILTDVAGKELKQGTKSMRTPVNGSAMVEELKLAGEVDQYGDHNLLLWVELFQEGEVVSRDLVAFRKPKSMDLVDPEISVKVSELDNTEYVVNLNSKYSALFAFVELEGVDGKLSDNFCHLRPGAEICISVKPAEKLSPAEFEKKLLVRSLWHLK